VKDAQTIYGITKAWFQRQEIGVQGWANAFWNGVTTLELAKFVEFALEEEISGLCHLHSPTPISKLRMLSLFRQVYGGPDIQISAKLLDKPIDKTIVSTRDDISYKVPGVEQQLYDLQAWYKKVDDPS
jgi:dTDP-4-dehydrorhamnose reductase